MKRVKILRKTFLVVTLSVWGLTTVAVAAPITNIQRLSDLSLEFAAQLQQGRTQMYLELLTGSDPAAKRLNDDSDLELMYINDRGMPVYFTTHNINAARTISTDDVWPGGAGGFSLDGAGTALGEMAVWDAGAVLVSHQEFGGRVTQIDSPGSTHFHSTHVAGTMAASGVNGSAIGMSRAALLAAYDWNSDESEMATAGAAGLNVSNHSYGTITGWRFSNPDWYWYGDVTVSTTEDYGFGFYDSQARDWDQIAYNAPYYLICKSAGNDRTTLDRAPAARTSIGTARPGYPILLPATGTGALTASTASQLKVSQKIFSP